MAEHAHILTMQPLADLRLVLKSPIKVIAILKFQLVVYMLLQIRALLTIQLVPILQ